MLINFLWGANLLMDRLTFWFSCSRLSRRQIILENVACFLAVSTSEIAVQTLCSLLFFVLIARLDVSFWKLFLPLHFAVWNWKAGRHQSYISQVSKYSINWPHPLASSMDCGCSKIWNHGLNHGLLLSLFMFLGWKYILNWMKIQD